MKNLILILLLLLPQKNPQEQFGAKYDEAIKFIRKNSSKIHTLIDYEGGNEAIIVSIIFPELIRYSMWKDYFETKANELLYINGDTHGKYFSIGMFQLKPTFAEKVEQEIRNHPELSGLYLPLYTFNTDNEIAIREERLNRLKTWQWQLRYVVAFSKIVEHRFNIKELPIEEKINFYSSAYNHDFLCDSLEVTRWINRKTFPYGIRHESNPFSYAEVANFFYKNHYHEIFRRTKK